MRIGLDFDNTIVCYDNAIEMLSYSVQGLPLDVERTKEGIKSHFMKEGQGESWTVFQGELYGPGMRYAKPYPDALDCIKTWIEEGHHVEVISHRSRKPYAGTAHDLHSAAKAWIEANLEQVIPHGQLAARFYEKKEDKIKAIAQSRCDYFVDDLVEIANDPMLSGLSGMILFDPNEKHDGVGITRVTRWKDIKALVG